MAAIQSHTLEALLLELRLKPERAAAAKVAVSANPAADASVNLFPFVATAGDEHRPISVWEAIWLFEAGAVMRDPRPADIARLHEVIALLETTLAKLKQLR